MLTREIGVLGLIAIASTAHARTDCGDVTQGGTGSRPGQGACISPTECPPASAGIACKGARDQAHHDARSTCRQKPDPQNKGKQCDLKSRDLDCSYACVSDGDRDHICTATVAAAAFKCGYCEIAGGGVGVRGGSPAGALALLAIATAWLLRRRLAR